MGSPGRDAKRLLDLVAGSIALTLSLPIVIAATLATRLACDRGPVFYKAIRIGEGGRPFRMLKLRTMVTTPHGPGLTRARDPRVTRMGRILRRLKIDELPQLWNVVRGEMSLVGPRPEDARYIDWGDPLHRRVFTAKPGITGLSQVAFPFEEGLLTGPDPERMYREHILPTKVMIDAYYLEHWSLGLDLRVLSWTVLSVFAGTTGSPAGGVGRLRDGTLTRMEGIDAAVREVARQQWAS